MARTRYVRRDLTSRLPVEELENRITPTTTWTRLSNLLPDPILGADQMSLRTDGTVEVQAATGGASNQWELCSGLAVC